MPPRMSGSLWITDAIAHLARSKDTALSAAIDKAIQPAETKAATRVGG